MLENAVDVDTWLSWHFLILLPPVRRSTAWQGDGFHKAFEGFLGVGEKLAKLGYVPRPVLKLMEIMRKNNLCLATLIMTRLL
jgi:hypothetical protein